MPSCSRLMTLAKPGDEILVEDLTYPGITDLASHLHLRLRTVGIDREGVIAGIARTGLPNRQADRALLHALVPESHRRADVGERGGARSPRSRLRTSSWSSRTTCTGFSLRS